MNVHTFNQISKLEFKGKLPSAQKKAISNFTYNYLMGKDGYASSKDGILNGLVIPFRGLTGVLITGWLMHTIPKWIQNDFQATLTQAATGIGSLLVALSRHQVDKKATGRASVEVKPFVEKLKEAGFKTREEILYGVRQFMKKKGGFYTAILPGLSSKHNARILDKIKPD